ncbi:hypothetical protein ACRPFF_08645 [Neisseria sp. SLRRB23]|uniref:hypothetical protein n=1 Tax=Neisseria sp. SLRRB23 TaxID=3435199 RepID=UPI003D7F1FBF
MHWIGVPADRSVTAVSFGYRSSNGSNTEMPKSRLPEMLFFLKHHDLHEKCRLKNISDGISSLRQ